MGASSYPASVNQQNSRPQLAGLRKNDCRTSPFPLLTTVVMVLATEWRAAVCVTCYVTEHRCITLRRSQP